MAKHVARRGSGETRQAMRVFEWFQRWELGRVKATFTFQLPFTHPMFKLGTSLSLTSKDFQLKVL